MKNEIESIRTWLDSKPTNEEVSKVFNLINKGALAKLRVEFGSKELELKKLVKLQTGWKNMGLASNVDLEQAIKKLTGEVEEMRKLLPPKRIVVRKNQKKQDEVPTVE